MVGEEGPRGRRGFYQALGNDEHVFAGALAITFGLDPYSIIAQDPETYMFKMAMLKKAVELRNQYREEDILALGHMLGTAALT